MKSIKYKNFKFRIKNNKNVVSKHHSYLLATSSKNYIKNFSVIEKLLDEDDYYEPKKRFIKKNEMVWTTSFYIFGELYKK